MVVFAVVAFSAIGWSIGWILLSMSLRANLDQWMDARRADGEVLVHGDRTLDGFPFAIRFSFANVEWRRVDGQRRLSASTDRLDVEAVAWSPRVLRLSSPSPIALSWEAPSLEARLSAATAAGAIDLARAPVDRVTLTLDDVLALDSGRRVMARSDRLTLDVDPTPPRIPASPGAAPATLILKATVDGLEPTESLPLRLPFDGPADASLRATVRGPLPLDIDPAELALWRDAGGVVDIDRLRVDWRPLDLTAEGTLALDGLMRPEGAATAEIRGLPETIDRSVDLGLMAPGLGALLKLATVAFSRTGSDGGSPAVQAPVTIQDGRLSIGPVAVARVPSLIR